MIKKRLLLCVFLAVSVQVCTQTTEDEVAVLIDGIGWDSFKVISNYGSKLDIGDPNAKRLVQLGKSKVSAQLIPELKNKKKTVIVHLILTKLWEADVYFLKKNRRETLDGTSFIT